MSAVVLDLLIQLMIFSLITLGLDFIVGYTKIFSVNQALLFAIGAFTFAFCANTLNRTDLLLAWAIAVPCACAVSALAGLVSLRVRGDYFVVISFGLQTIGMQVIFNATSISGGASGTFGLPPVSVFGWQAQTQNDVLILVTVVAGLAYLLVTLLVRSPWGRLLRAVGEDEVAVEAAGFNVPRLKIVGFILGGALAALAGPLYVGYLGIAQVGDYSLNVSISLLAMVILGGAGRILGGLVGAAIFVGVPYLLNQFTLPLTMAAYLKQGIFGLLLLAIVVGMPSGLTGGVALLWHRIVHPGTRSERSATLRQGAREDLAASKFEP